MNAIKFAHLADSHLGGWREEKMRYLNSESFKKAVDVCIEKNVDFVLISGAFVGLIDVGNSRTNFTTSYSAMMILLPSSLISITAVVWLTVRCPCLLNKRIRLIEAGSICSTGSPVCSRIPVYRSRIFFLAATKIIRSFFWLSSVRGIGW